MQLESMYQEIILDHYRHPHHKGLREPYATQVHHVNPTCGDEVTLRVHLSGSGEDAVVEDVSYDAEGCSISQAATSVMTDLVIGKPLREALSVHEEFLSQGRVRGRAPRRAGWWDRGRAGRWGAARRRRFSRWAPSRRPS